MTVELQTGSIFDADASAIVIPVNCVGIAGKGLALEAKTRWPGWFDSYRHACAEGRIAPGRCAAHVLDDGQDVVSFPTKRQGAFARLDAASKGEMAAAEAFVARVQQARLVAIRRERAAVLVEHGHVP